MTDWPPPGNRLVDRLLGDVCALCGLRGRHQHGCSANDDEGHRTWIETERIPSEWEGLLSRLSRVLIRRPR